MLGFCNSIFNETLALKTGNDQSVACARGVPMLCANFRRAGKRGIAAKPV
jgi:hypothetical protein